MYADTFWVGRGVSATLKHICIHMLTNNSSLSKFDFTLFYIPRKKNNYKDKGTRKQNFIQQIIQIEEDEPSIKMHTKNMKSFCILLRKYILFYGVF